jgi:Ser/Thr protein kinase RdoA (MazF antagonist)
VDIKFSDGVVWIARFRLLKINRPLITEKINFDRASEVAVYRHLNQRAIPVPSVYDFAYDGDQNNPVGVGYILLEKLPGHPMDWSEASIEQKSHVLRH